MIGRGSSCFEYLSDPHLSFGGFAEVGANVLAICCRCSDAVATDGTVTSVEDALTDLGQFGDHSFRNRSVLLPDQTGGLPRVVLELRYDHTRTRSNRTTLRAQRLSDPLSEPLGGKPRHSVAAGSRVVRLSYVEDGVFVDRRGWDEGTAATSLNHLALFD